VLACLFVINTYFVLEIFNESLCAVSQSIAFVTSQLTEFYNYPRLAIVTLNKNCITSEKFSFHKI